VWFSVTCGWLTITQAIPNPNADNSITVELVVLAILVVSINNYWTILTLYCTIVPVVGNSQAVHIQGRLAHYTHQEQVGQDSRGIYGHNEP